MTATEDLKMKLAAPNLISNFYFPAVAAADRSLSPQIKASLNPLARTMEILNGGLTCEDLMAASAVVLRLES
jgi:hypothetical protein